MARKKEKHKEPTIASGMDDQKELEESATKNEVAEGEYTEVTHLSYDEVEPS
ncbi:hypothetical protein J2Z23_001938 [Lederbergia galactosidilyticus]|uniref:hypothetical protein n=1 Tax=Lederbergia galactosidilytica TaxID=217031 RepID=UPI000B0E0638|nr:hypothetical protein [Lederbergia galactosidilytica]MBP1914983.1 hypothetical protein [Lederbergia galactosidilytica]